ncbi:class I SAM-dependent methyltransferase [bacterium]|nr:class I SAM-dependent methyltransferase [bacterium]
MIRASVEDFSSELVEIPCPLCGNTSHNLRHSVRDRLNIPLCSKTGRPQDLTYSIVACSSCGLLYLNPRPKLSELARFYDSEDYDPHTGSGSGWMGRLFHLARAFTLQWKYAATTSGMVTGSALDVGCGTGEFLQHITQKGWQVLGIEQDAEAAHIADSKGVEVLAGDPTDLLPVDKQFDLVTMWHSLEHLPRLNQAIRNIADTVKPGGRLCIAVPNPLSYDAIRYGERWAAWDAPRHLYHFRPEDVKTLVESQELKLLSIKAMPLDAFYHSLLSVTCWADHKGGIGNLADSFLTGLISFVIGMNPRRSSGVLYLFSK